MLALQQKADSLTDVLSVDRELRQVQGDIEQIQGRTNYLSKRSEMPSITIGLSPEEVVAQPQPAPTQSWQPADAALKAWNASLELLSGAATVIITVGVFLWWAVPLLLIGWLVLVRLRRRPNSQATSNGEPSVS